MSKSGFFGILGVLLLVLIGLYVTQQTSQNNIASDLLFPELARQLNSVDELRVVGAQNQTKVSVQKKDDQWVVADKMGYPADVATIRTLLQKLAQAKLLEQKTSKPELYGRLGVEGMDSENPTGLLLELISGDTTRSLVVGNTGVSGGDASYVRVPTAVESWLVDQDLSLEANPVEWLNRTVLDVTTDRVQQVEVTIADQSLKVFKENPAQTNFAVENVPADRELRYEGVANSLAGVLSGLEIDDVRLKPADIVPPSFVANYLTFDGLRVVLAGFELDSKQWLSIAASVDEAQAEKFAPPKADTEAGKPSATCRRLPNRT